MSLAKIPHGTNVPHTHGCQFLVLSTSKLPQTEQITCCPDLLGITSVAEMICLDLDLLRTPDDYRVRFVDVRCDPGLLLRAGYFHSCYFFHFMLPLDTHGLGWICQPFFDRAIQSPYT